MSIDEQTKVNIEKLTDAKTLARSLTAKLLYNVALAKNNALKRTTISHKNLLYYHGIAKTINKVLDQITI